MDQETESEATDDEGEDEAAEDEAAEDGEDTSMLSIGEEELCTGNPYWLLFKAVVTQTDEKNRPMAKPFLKLPNRRFYQLYTL